MMRLFAKIDGKVNRYDRPAWYILGYTMDFAGGGKGEGPVTAAVRMRTQAAVSGRNVRAQVL